MIIESNVPQIKCNLNSHYIIKYSFGKLTHISMYLVDFYTKTCFPPFLTHNEPISFVYNHLCSYINHAPHKARKKIHSQLHPN